MRGSGLTALCAAVVTSGFAANVRAGVPECGNLRLEDVGSCEIRGEIDCDAGCASQDVFRKACATKLHTVCRSECSLSAEAGCTDSCTEQCSRDCDRGVNVICSHNCFGECTGACDVNCAGVADEADCRATCEATCDGECDIKCRPLVDGSCYKHCIECCGGSCTAMANLECQTTCQEEQFEDCEYELELDCSAECEGDGAIFCDGEYVLGGRQIPACAAALLARGIAELDLEGHVGASIDTSGGKSRVQADGDLGAGAKCSAQPGTQRADVGYAVLAALLAVSWKRRAKRRSH